MTHVFEAASSGRAKCRGCGRAIARGQIRFGERLPNLFGEGDMTLWFHPMCAAYKRPESVRQALEAAASEAIAGGAVAIPDREKLERAAASSATQRRRPRIDGAEHSPTGQARCRSCREPILRGTWRIRIAYFEEGRFLPGGFVHLACRLRYFEADDVLEQVLYFSPALGESDREELRKAFQEPPAPPSASESESAPGDTA